MAAWHGFCCHMQGLPNDVVAPGPLTVFDHHGWLGQYWLGLCLLLLDVLLCCSLLLASQLSACMIVKP